MNTFKAFLSLSPVVYTSLSASEMEEKVVKI